MLDKLRKMKEEIKALTNNPQEGAAFAQWAITGMYAETDPFDQWYKTRHPQDHNPNFELVPLEPDEYYSPVAGAVKKR